MIIILMINIYNCEKEKPNGEIKLESLLYVLATI